MMLVALPGLRRCGDGARRVFSTSDGVVLGDEANGGTDGETDDHRHIDPDPSLGSQRADYGERR